MNKNKLKSRITIRFTDEEAIEFARLLEKYKYQKASKLIKRCIFHKEMYVVTYDENLYDIIDKLSEILYLYRKNGVNYNQVVVHLKRVFDESKAGSLIQRLAQNTIELVQLTEKQIMPIVGALKEKYSNGSKN